VTNSARPLDDVLAPLCDALEDRRSSTSPRVESVLQGLAERPAVTKLLRSVMADDKTLAEIAENSYEHVLGFDKIVVLSKPPFWRLRLHVWWPSRVGSREHPHNHRYASHSVVVVGKLHTYIHAIGASGNAVTHYREESAPAENRWTFSLIGATCLETAMDVVLLPGTNYSMSPNVIHHVEVPQELTVTLFLELQRARDWSEVFVHAGDPPPAPHSQRAFTKSELRLRLSRIRDAFEYSCEPESMHSPTESYRI